MQRASRVLAAGADFTLLGPSSTMLQSSKPVVAVCAVRTGAGKSQTGRELLGDAGLHVALIRHPMPYHDLEAMRVQRFATIADIDRSNPTIEEREEYERAVPAGLVLYAGVDYAAILEAAEAEADVIVRTARAGPADGRGDTRADHPTRSSSRVVRRFQSARELGAGLDLRRLEPWSELRAFPHRISRFSRSRASRRGGYVCSHAMPTHQLRCPRSAGPAQRRDGTCSRERADGWGLIGFRRHREARWLALLTTGRRFSCCWPISTVRPVRSASA
jgi:hypothetical protein